MTTDQSFKRVVRARMAKTGERYAAARRALIAERPPTDAGKRCGRRRAAATGTAAASSRSRRASRTSSRIRRAVPG